MLAPSVPAGWNNLGATLHTEMGCDTDNCVSRLVSCRSMVKPSVTDLYSMVVASKRMQNRSEENF